MICDDCIWFFENTRYVKCLKADINLYTAKGRLAIKDCNCYEKLLSHSEFKALEGD